MRVFLGLIEISGYFANLKKGFIELGIDCTFISLVEHKFQYGCDDNPIYAKIVKYVNRKRAKSIRASLIKKVIFKILNHISMLLLFLWALIKHDVFIFISNGTFYYFYDLFILKLFKKKIIYLYVGSDSRPPYINGAIMLKDEGSILNECYESTKKMKRKIKKVEKYADAIISNPPSSHFFKRFFIQWLIVGMPYDINLNKNISRINGNEDPIRILHAPSAPHSKGTFKIREIIKSLKRKDYEIDYVEIIGVPNSVVLDELKKCDFVFTQMYSDTPMPGFPTEAAFYSKPAVLGGYYSMYINEDLPLEAIPPSDFCHPDKVEEAVERLISNEGYRKDLGKRAYDFVTKNWSPRKVAERYIKIINNDAPKEWFYNPNNIRYPYGGGMHEDQAKASIIALVNTYGEDALGLDDKPELKKIMLEFAGLF